MEIHTADGAMGSTFGYLLHLEAEVTIGMNIPLGSGEWLHWLKYPEVKLVKENGTWKDLWDPGKWDENIKVDSDEAGKLKHLNFTKSLLEVVISSLPKEFTSSFPKETTMISHELVASKSTSDPLQDLAPSPLHASLIFSHD